MNNEADGLLARLLAAAIRGIRASALAAMVLTAPAAVAQSEAEEEEEPSWAPDYWDGSGNETILKRDVENLATMIGADADTREALVGIQQEYEQRMRADGKKLWRYQEKVREAAEGEGWTEELTKKNSDSWTKFSERKVKLREQVVADLKLMLTDDQMTEVWPKFEARIERRRAMANLGGWSMTGITADVVGVVENAFKDSEVPEEISTILADYERELDLKVQDVQKKVEELNQAQPTESEMQDDKARMAFYGRQQLDRYEALRPVREYHIRTIERVVEALPEALAARVQREFYQSSFGDRWGWIGSRESGLDEGMAKLDLLKDLTPEQKQEIAAIRAEADLALSGSARDLAGAFMDAEERQLKKQAEGDENAYYDPEMWQEGQRLLIERMKVEQGFVDRLRAILTDEQRNKAGRPFNLRPGNAPKLEFED